MKHSARLAQCPHHQGILRRHIGDPRNEASVDNVALERHHLLGRDRDAMQRTDDSSGAAEVVI